MYHTSFRQIRSMNDLKRVGCGRGPRCYVIRLYGDIIATLVVQGLVQVDLLCGETPYRYQFGIKTPLCSLLTMHT